MLHIKSFFFSLPHFVPVKTLESPKKKKKKNSNSLANRFESVWIMYKLIWINIWITEQQVIFTSSDICKIKQVL